MKFQMILIICVCVYGEENVIRGFVVLSEKSFFEVISLLVEP